MSYMAVSNTSVTITKGLHIDHYDGLNHTFIDIQSNSKLQENDAIFDIIVSANGKYLALITSISKQLLIYDLPLSEKCKSFILPRSASKIRFTTNQDQILVADKSGDALIYNIKEEDTGTKLLGHLSLLLDVLQTSNGKFVITTDRDEKIRVSRYPNTYNIQTYCLGHKEFVNHIELLPHNDSYLTSTSGDGHLKVWNYVDGKQCYTIDTYLDVNDAELKDNFTKFMDSEGVEVNTLPIVHYDVMQLDANSSLLAVFVHTFNNLLLYNLQTVNKEFTHKLAAKLPLNRFPTAIKFHNFFLYVYDNVDSEISVFKIVNDNRNVSLPLDRKIKMFESRAINSDISENNNELIKILYKRKFDNVQEYLERKRQRMEKSLQQ